MIYYPIHKLIESGIDKILIVTGTEHMGSVVSLLGSGKDFGCAFTYKVQDQAGGIAQALSLAENFSGGDSIAVILGDNLFEDGIGPLISHFKNDQGGRGARIALKQVSDPRRFGVATLKEDRVVRIMEKPEFPETNWAVTGLYVYDGGVFDIIKKLKPSTRGELEISDVNNSYIAEGSMRYDFLEGWWTDAGTFESLAKANELLGGKE